MKKVATQFDTLRHSTTISTPSCCGSSSCCCCCLATTIASSSLLAQRINKEAKREGLRSRKLLVLVAALFLPLAGLLTYAGWRLTNSLTRTCATESYSDVYGVNEYLQCTSPGNNALFLLVFFFPALVLWFLYSRVHIDKPVRRALMITGLIAVGFIAEFFVTGYMLMLTPLPPILYLIFVPLAVGWISVWYRNHLGTEDAPAKHDGATA